MEENMLKAFKKEYPKVNIWTQVGWQREVKNFLNEQHHSLYRSLNKVRAITFERLRWECSQEKIVPSKFL